MTESARRRLSKQDRHAQLLAVAGELIRAIGPDAFTLARLAEQAGVTKPLVYDHFGDRAGVFAELYRQFDARQHEMLDAALAGTEPNLGAVAGVVAGAYIDCAIAEGKEVADVVAALSCSPDLERLRRDAEEIYVGKCRTALAPFAADQSIDIADLRAILGAADALARAALTGQIDVHRARESLTNVIVAVTAR